MNQQHAVDQDSQKTPSPNLTGIIFDIQRWSSKDGPGIRTIVFFKGCPLRCAWCCNPESWIPQPQIALFAERCRGCLECQAVCPQSIATPLPFGADTQTRSSDCIVCGLCVEACAFGAREVMGRRMYTSDILSVIEKDRVFYRQSGGGVTFSGGEALAQAAFLSQLVEACWSRGVPMALETCGHFSWEKSKDILARMELVFFDLKHMDPVVHQRATGVDNQRILQNAIRIARENIPFIIRVPLIPTINDDDTNIAATAAFIAEHLDGVLGVEVLPYHMLGKGKYQSIGLEYPIKHLVPPAAGTIARVKEIFWNHDLEVL